MLKRRPVHIIVAFDEKVRVTVIVKVKKNTLSSYVRPSSYNQINNPIQPRNEVIVPGDQEDYSNMLSHSWFAERSTSIHICDI